MSSPKLRRMGVFVVFMAALPLVVAAQVEKPSVAAQMEELFAAVNRSDGPGAAVAAIQDGQTVYENAFGMADLERRVALTPSSVFEIGSVSKQFTAMAILLLEEDGKVSLEDDIRTHLPEMPTYESPITIAHLLHHTSGIRDIETLLPMAGWPYSNYYSPWQQYELISRQQKLNFSPGEQFLYSNSGYSLLALIVERVSGKTLREFADERIFQPLGMRQSVFWDAPEQIVPDRALAYEPGEDGSYGLQMWYMPFVGPSGVYTSLADLARWDANFYDNKLGGGAGLIEKMTTPGKLNNGDSTDYAGGLFVGPQEDYTLINHNGAWMGYRAWMARFPERRLTLIMLSNAADIAVSTRAIADAFLHADDESGESEPAENQSSEEEVAEAEPATIDVSPEVLAEYEGTYWNESDYLLRTIEVRDGALHYVREEGNATELGALEPSEFIMLDVGVHVDVQFPKPEDGGSPTMTVEVEGQDLLTFRRLEELPAGSTAEYNGTFWSDDLARELRLHVDDQKVLVSWADEDRQVEAIQLGADDLLARAFVPIPWYTQDLRILLERDESGQITGLDMSCDMVRHLSLAKVTSD